MAGGKGTRLLPYTAVLPKPLMPLGDAPVLELLLQQLRSCDCRRVCLAVNHLRHLIQAFFGDGSSVGLEIEYAVEDIPLGTCGPVSQVLDRMNDDFLLLNGDLVTDLDMRAMLAHHRARGAGVTVAVLRQTTRLDYGIIEINDDGRIESIREKPTMQHLVSMGVYVLRREAVRPFLEPGKPLDMPDLLNAMMQAGGQVDAFVADCEWLDIGKPADYAKAQQIIAEDLHRFLPERR